MRLQDRDLYDRIRDILLWILCAIHLGLWVWFAFLLVYEGILGYRV